jgi:hypothetical protein
MRTGVRTSGSERAFGVGDAIVLFECTAWGERSVSSVGGKKKSRECRARDSLDEEEGTVVGQLTSGKYPNSSASSAR